VALPPGAGRRVLTSCPSPGPGLDNDEDEVRGRRRLCRSSVLADVRVGVLVSAGAVRPLSAGPAVVPLSGRRWPAGVGRARAAARLCGALRRPHGPARRGPGRIRRAAGKQPRPVRCCRGRRAGPAVDDVRSMSAKPPLTRRRSGRAERKKKDRRPRVPCRQLHPSSQTGNAGNGGAGDARGGPVFYAVLRASERRWPFLPRARSRVAR